MRGHVTSLAPRLQPSGYKIVHTVMTAAVTRQRVKTAANVWFVCVCGSKQGLFVMHGLNCGSASLPTVSAY